MNAPGYQVPRDPTSVMGLRILAFIVDFGLYALLLFAVGPSPLNPLAEYVAVPDEMDWSEACEQLGQQEDVFECIQLGDRAYFIDGTAAAIQFVAVLLFIGLIYVAWQGATGQTPGKALARIKVVREDGQSPGPGRAFLRTLLWVVDSVPWCFPAVGLITALTSTGHRRVGDMAAKTYVVSKADAGRPVVLPGVTPAYAGPPAGYAPAAGYGPPATYPGPGGYPSSPGGGPGAGPGPWGAGPPTGPTPTPPTGGWGAPPAPTGAPPATTPSGWPTAPSPEAAAAGAIAAPQPPPSAEPPAEPGAGVQGPYPPYGAGAAAPSGEVPSTSGATTPSGETPAQAPTPGGERQRGGGDAPAPAGPTVGAEETTVDATPGEQASPAAQTGDAEGVGSEPPEAAPSEGEDVVPGAEAPDGGATEAPAVATGEPEAPGEPGTRGEAELAGPSQPASEVAPGTAAAPGTEQAPAAAQAPTYNPQWDAARGTYIQWDAARGHWLQWDDNIKQWKPI